MKLVALSGSWVEKMGEEWALSCFAEYPIIDFTISDDDL